MKYLLHKILPVFLLPVGLTAILVLLGLVLRRRALVVLGVAILVICSLPVVSSSVMNGVEGGVVRLPAVSADSADAVVVLSTGRGRAPGPEGISEWSDADRFFAGIDLFQARKAPLLVLTDGITRNDPTLEKEGALLRRYALALGVADSSIRVSRPVWNTADEAIAVAQLLQNPEKEKPSVILVTSAFHMPRSVRLFDAAGFDVRPFPVDFRGRYRPLTVLDFFPTADALETTELAIRELYGRAFYAIF